MAIDRSRSSLGGICEVEARFRATGWLVVGVGATGSYQRNGDLGFFLFLAGGPSRRLLTPNCPRFAHDLSAVLRGNKTTFWGHSLTVSGPSSGSASGSFFDVANLEASIMPALATSRLTSVSSDFR